MDESFSDFKEKKKCNTGPKNIQKTKVKSVQRKSTKKIKNQKDIRGFVKDKENELVSYTKKFNEVCEKSGLDVNSEQLQLAIALSKSLQHSGSSVDGHNSKEETPISSEERCAKIKLTLQEYGFKVPTTKINTNKRRKLKKQYKLLLLSAEEKKRIITDRYYKILETSSYLSLKDNIQFNYKSSELFYKATNIPFENIKNNEIFYVEDLNLEISHNISSLRDWSKIPGRPLSPTIEVNNFKFTDTNFKQEELDLILSGTQKNVKGFIINKKHIKETETMGVENIEICIHDDVEVEDIIEKSHSLSNSNFKNILGTDRLSVTQNMVSVQRSISPDIFDDDITILESISSAKTNEVAYDKKENETCFMDLTECVAINNVDLCKTKVNICHKNNVCNRKSNDYMDITECVPSTKEICIENIDLTQLFIPFEKTSINKRTDNKITSNKENIETMDLTQSSNSDDETEVIEPKDNKNESSDDTIIINDNSNKIDNIVLTIGENDFSRKSFSYDNTKNLSVNISNEIQNKNETWTATESSETVPIDKEDAILIEEKNCSPTYAYTDHIFDHSYIYDYDNFDDNSQEIGVNNSSDESSIIKKSTEDGLIKSDTISDSNKKSCSSINNETSVNHEKIVLENCKSATNNDNLSGCYKYNELTQVCDAEKSNDISNIAKEIDTKETDTEKVLLNGADENSDETNHASQLEEYNDYVFEHSYVYDCDDGYSLNVKNNDDNENEIDLTQTSDVLPTENDIKNNLGKIDNISIDYDEVIVIENVNSNNISKCSSLAHDKEASNCSENSEVFEVSDKEFNYSLHQSRFDNYDVDGFDDVEIAAKKSCTLNRSMSENDLNHKDDSKRTKTKNSFHNTTPVKALSQDVKAAIMQTPNNDYIVKTRDVTPMADYVSMSSPERNEELKRYGLKPFKRKRAIQLLTYLYNQTHPVVESNAEISSPAKRLKYDTPKQKSPKKSPKKSQSSKSTLKSCDLGNIEATDNILYIQTKDLPDIKEIHSDPEDWVFQTREKSKVHSCRVPLHIAFHNYVTCRRYLRESILRYEPVNIDVIHKELVSIGYRYNPKDLLKFMDKKCITVKTTDNNARNRR